jgi:hypothetical protein
MILRNQLFPTRAALQSSSSLSKHPGSTRCSSNPNKRSTKPFPVKIDNVTVDATHVELVGRGAYEVVLRL